MCSVPMVFPCGSFPLESMLRGCADFGFATIIDVLQFLAIQGPLEGFEIGCGFAGLKNHVEQWTTLKESQESCIAVVSIEFLKIPSKRFAKQRVERFLTRMLTIEAIVGENVAWNDFRLEAKLDVVPKENVRVRCEKVARDAVMVGGNVRG